MTAEGSLITDEMRALIGVENPPRRFEVDRTGIRMFARSVGYTDPVFYDPEEAKRRGYRDIIAPPGYLGTPVFNPATDAGPRQRPGGLARALNAGNEYEYYDVITAGDVLEARSKIANMVERSGSIGQMLITTTETLYTRLSDGKAVAKAVNTGISY